MYKVLFILFITANTIVPLLAQGPPANMGTSPSPHAIEIQQPDNTKIKVLGKGNMDVSYTETADGYTVVINDKGVYEYAVKSRGGKLCPGGVKAKDPAERTKDDLKYLEKTPKNLRYGSKYLKKLKKKRESSNQ